MTNLPDYAGSMKPNEDGTMSGVLTDARDVPIYVLATPVNGAGPFFYELTGSKKAPVKVRPEQDWDFGA